MKKKIILKFASLIALIWFCIPFKIRKFLFTSFFIIESRGHSAKNGLKRVFKIKDKLEWIINERAVQYGNGVHPKHSLIGYHNFFIDRIINGEVVLDVGCGSGLSGECLDEQVIPGKKSDTRQLPNWSKMAITEL